MSGTPHYRPPTANRLVDGPCPEVDPPTLDKHSGANPERQVGVELSYNRGNSGDRGSTQGLPSYVLDVEVEKCVGGRKTPLSNE